MPKIIELTVELDIQKVSCPGVWLCQDGRVSLTVFALGTSYQTCMLPPIFPLMFKDLFYFRKRFQETCALNNICCLLNDETIYCELIQWSEHCKSGESTVLAQYLGALNDVLFPPNMCTSDGIDLLMRRSKEFPGILSPKIEISTKVRIDEVWNQPCHPVKPTPCRCSGDPEPRPRQGTVCHSPEYHRMKCQGLSPPRSCVNLTAVSPPTPTDCKCSSMNPCRSRGASPRLPHSLHCRAGSPPPPPPLPPQPPPPPRRTRPPPPRCSDYDVYNLSLTSNWPLKSESEVTDDENRSSSVLEEYSNEEIKKRTLESRYIEEIERTRDKHRNITRPKGTPCVCEICKRYHDLFHSK